MHSALHAQQMHSATQHSTAQHSVAQHETHMRFQNSTAQQPSGNRSGQHAHTHALLYYLWLLYNTCTLTHYSYLDVLCQLLLPSISHSSVPPVSPGSLTPLVSPTLLVSLTPPVSLTPLVSPTPLVSLTPPVCLTPLVSQTPLVSLMCLSRVPHASYVPLVPADCFAFLTQRAVRGLGRGGGAVQPCIHVRMSSDVP